MRWQSVNVKNPVESAKRYQRLFAANVMELKDPFGSSSFFINLAGTSLRLVGMQGVNAEAKKRIKLHMPEKDVFTVVDSLIKERELFQVESISGNLFYTDADGNVFEIVCVN
ncbi:MULTISPECIES: hypothetical protein [unclassified Cellvibrio]|uniref:hypothetical protein n=1 Tax=unclassified Cellvibrio TaxID=2624793 RepID=UPI0012460BAC|nr:MULTISPECIES: hypothetical protein [unclassified Cellvibrio]QEY14898.1 hypothetical protein D0C16_02275 [Cellvibrio sp. KY-GH-1]UUA73825.1 hypothetical protein NNX04_05115 [Cellvibrio sp. QJXJ]